MWESWGSRGQASFLPERKTLRGIRGSGVNMIRPVMGSRSWILASGVVLCLFLIPRPGEPSDLRRSAVVKAVDRASPAVVNVNTEQRASRRSSPFQGFPGDSFFDEFFRDFMSPVPRGQSRASLGSGVIIDSRGFILTNEHVIQGASAIRVTLGERREFLAKPIGTDPPSDLAVLRIETNESLPVIPMGRSNDLMIGETVIAIGNPFGLSHTVTTGVISALNRSVRTEPRVYQDFIQTDAAINPGNSGGPLLNIDGELIGITTAIYQKAQGVGFAIPIDRAKRIFQELIQHGEVQPAWIGLEAQTLDDRLAGSFRVEGRKGALVTQVAPNGPAERAGVRRGDLVIGVGQSVVTSREDLIQNLSSYTASSTVPLLIWSGGREKTVQIRAEALNPSDAVKAAEERLGITVSPITPALRKEHKLNTDLGVLVVGVEPQGMAHRTGIRRGDMIRQVNDQEIKGSQDYEKAMVRALRRDSLTLLIQRGGYGYYVTLELGGAG
jgi:serine protease Do